MPSESYTQYARFIVRPMNLDLDSEGREWNARELHDTVTLAGGEVARVTDDHYLSDECGRLAVVVNDPDKADKLLDLVTARGYVPLSYLPAGFTVDVGEENGRDEVLQVLGAK